MKSSSMRNLSLNLILFILLLNMVLQQDYYFQMYPSLDEDKSYLFHAYIQPSEFITINTTEGEVCKTIEKKTVTETATRNLSSVFIYENKLLVKTCFNPGKLVEIINKNNIIFSRTKTSLNNIKYCYSTKIYNPKNQNKNAIFTYWTEFRVVNGKEKYIHKCILFYIEENTFSNEITLTPYSNIINYFINDNYYPQNCITFENQDIYCDIYFGSSESTFYENSFVIETQNLFTSGRINLVYSKDFDKEVFHRPISIGCKIRDSIEGGLFDVFLTQYHDKINSATFLLSSLYRKSFHSTYIFKFNFFRRYYGINIENQYLEPNLFNVLIPNKRDLMVVYIMKKNNKNLLIMSRFNLTYTTESHSFEEMSISNYLREGDICSEPKYMQSIFINSFINYNNKDKEIINNNGANNYYKYQKNIVSLISCKNSQNDVIYDTKKISIPQCLNTLDEINGKDKHILRFESDKNFIIFDIYNDPNYASLRDVGIEFIYESPILINYKLKGADSFRALDKNDYNITINGITHIKFVKTQNIKSSTSLYLYYRLKKTDSSGNSIKCHLSSDICQLEFRPNSNCNVQYCKYCFENECQECEDIEGLILDKQQNKCMCDEEKGFKPEPDMINKMCLCKPNYSFYKNTTICKENTILKKNFCSNRKDDVSNIPIYDDCPNCTQNGTCPEDKTSDQCLISGNLEDNLWFKLGNYKFYYGKIENCVYIFDNDLKLFFYSNKKDCLFETNKIKNISICLNHPEIKDIISYFNFIDSAKEYKPNSTEVNIFKQIGNTNFNLINGQNSPKFSGIKLDDNINSKIKNIYNIPDELNLLVFKGDIRRSDTISTQVEYQFYNPIPNKIYEKIDFSKLNISLRNLDTDIKNIEVNLSLPIHWSKEQFEIIKDLYYDQHIFIFDSSNPFYLDVCYKFKNSNNSDVYLQDRKERYFINEAICEEGCHLVDDQNYYDVYEQTSKLVCQCPMKMILDNYTKIKFEKNETLDKRFIEVFTYPNFRVMKCSGNIFLNDNIKANVLFYITLFVFIIFEALIILRFCCKRLFKDPFEELKNEIDSNSENKYDNDIDSEEEESEDEEEESEKEEEEKMIEKSKEKENIDNRIPYQNNEKKKPKMIDIKNIRKSDLTVSVLPLDKKKNGDSNLIDSSKSDRNSGIINENKNDTNSNINNSTDKAYDINTEEENNNNNEFINKSSNKEDNSENGDNNNINNINNNDDKVSESNQVNKNRNEYDNANNNNNNNNNNLVQAHFLRQSQLPQSLDMKYILTVSQPIKSETNEANNDNKNDKDQNEVDENEEISEEMIEDIDNFDNDNDNEDEKPKIDVMKNTFTIKEDKKKHKKKKKKKKKSSNKEANPPKKNGPSKITQIENSINYKKKDDDKSSNIYPKTKRPLISIDDEKKTEQTDQDIENKNENQKMMEFYFKKRYDRLGFEEAKKFDKRESFETIISYVLNNSIILFLFKGGENDIFIRMSLLLLTISLYIFVNVAIMDTNAALNLYTQKNKENIIANALCPNMFYPLSTYLITYTIKRKISVNEFFNDIKYQFYRVLYYHDKKYISEERKDTELHNIEAKISLREIKAECRLSFLIIIGTIFLGINFYLVSSFCGIYEHSVDCLIWNTVVSIIFSYIVSRVLFLISACIRKYSLKKGKQSKCLFIISCLLNPYYMSYLKCCKKKKKYETKKKGDNKNGKDKKNEKNNKDNKDKKEDKIKKNLMEGMVEIQ